MELEVVSEIFPEVHAYPASEDMGALFNRTSNLLDVNVSGSHHSTKLNFFRTFSTNPGNYVLEVVASELQGTVCLFRKVYDKQWELQTESYVSQRVALGSNHLHIRSQLNRPGLVEQIGLV